jgi:hypothetical protein
LAFLTQQVQKYERGETQVPSARLMSLANAFDVSIESLLGKSEGRMSGSSIGLEFLATAQDLTIARAFLAIKNPRVRKAIAGLLSLLAEGYLTTNGNEPSFRAARSRWSVR